MTDIDTPPLRPTAAERRVRTGNPDPELPKNPEGRDPAEGAAALIMGGVRVVTDDIADPDLKDRVLVALIDLLDAERG